MELINRVSISYRSILQVGAWPSNMKYLTCDDFDGTNTPDHSIDLKSYFVEVCMTRETHNAKVVPNLSEKKLTYFYMSSFLIDQ